MERLFERTTFGDTSDDCWSWQGYTNEKGHGVIRLKQPEGIGIKYTHRVAWESMFGPIPPGFDIHHTCEDHACWNPTHIVCILHGEHSTITQIGRWHGRTAEL